MSIMAITQVIPILTEPFVRAGLYIFDEPRKRHHPG